MDRVDVGEAVSSSMFASLSADLVKGVMDAVSDAIVVADADGTIVLVNNYALEVLGYRREELVGRPVETLVPDGSQFVHPRHRAAYLAQAGPDRRGKGRRLSVRRRDGTTFPAEIGLATVSTETGPVTCAAIHDVTERVRAAAEEDWLRGEAERERNGRRLQQAERLESLGQLAGGVAHDFNNILGAIQGYASFVQEAVNDAEGGGTPQFAEMRADLEHVVSAAERAARLTRQLVVFARKEAATPEVLDLNEAIDDVDGRLRHALGGAITLITRLQPGVPAVLIDRGQLEQALINLALNARDAMETGGTLTVTTAPADITPYLAPHAGGEHSGLSHGRYAHIQVTDTGTGMTPPVLQRALEPFFTTKPKGEATGLGLATVYGIVKTAGGDIRLSSEPGEGTTVHLLLPAAESDVPAPIDAPSATETTAPTTYSVLIVEDEDDIRDVTFRILGRAGYAVHASRSGSEALQHCATLTNPIDLLVTDMVMPGMLGTELAAKLTAQWPHIKTLYMSGYSHGILDRTTTPDLLEKPFTPQTLLAAVERTIGSTGRGTLA